MANQQRVLICTPSNAAIDEVLSRLYHQGIFDDQEQSYVKGIDPRQHERRKIKLVRVGDSLEGASDVIKALSLDNQVEVELQKSGVWQTYNGIVQELEKSNDDYECFLKANPDFRFYEGRMAMYRKEAHYQEEAAADTVVDTSNKAGSTKVMSSATSSTKPGARTAKQALQEVKASIRAFKEIDNQLRQLKQEKYQYESELDKARHELRVRILKEADVVGTTLSSSGRSSFMETIIQENLTFPTVIIDEAGQTTEPSTLLPLRFGCRKLILVGDPRQLPPTVLSRTAEKAGLNRSLFERLERAEHEVVMLSIQYRMHPWIREFPSKFFYNNLLEDSVAIVRETDSWKNRRSDNSTISKVILEDGEETDQPLQFPVSTKPHDHGLVTSSLLVYLGIPPICFFDSGTFRQEISEQGHGTSYVNDFEIRQIISFLEKILPHLRDELSIGLISPYKAQVRRLVDGLRRSRIISDSMSRRTEESRRIEVNTVDGFQGREKDIVIFSCVRSNAIHANSKVRADGERSRGSVLGAIGFVADERRLNVAITRAKKSLVIFGHCDTLKLDPIWREMIESYHSREMVRKEPYTLPV